MGLRRKTIILTSGRFSINRQELWLPGQSVIVQNGQEIIIEAEVASSYLCVYGPWPEAKEGKLKAG